jgi:hypothetical protein
MIVHITLVFGVYFDKTAIIVAIRAEDINSRPLTSRWPVH